ncbi:GpE family phage tail protein [Piscirickettsia litoralis]|uniref:GpE family phage tail protein n=1 Tax=Piscirickettsia litoralis TaxID=1891921 RepID=UPI00373FDB9C
MGCYSIDESNCPFFSRKELLCNDIDEVFADLAFINHWSLSEMAAMTLDDLLLFHDLAMQRFESAHSVI